MGSILLRTDIPGPRSREWLGRLERSIPESLTPLVPIIAERAQGAVVTDLDGNRLIDLASGLGALNTGHGHPKVVERVLAQASKLIHTDFALVPYESYIRLAEALIERAPVRAKGKAVLFNSGAEAVENAVKIARRATGRSAVISFEGAFHGRTLMALSLTSRVDPYKLGFGPFAGDVHMMPFPHAFRHSNPAEATKECIEALERSFATRVAASDVAAIIVEPVQGEGGFVVPPPDFFKALRAVADRHDILLIVDEIQTGFGRTGRFFALEHFGIEADLMTVGKSLGAGFPLSAVVGRRDVMDAVHKGGIGGTTIGNPVACEAGLAVLDVIEEEKLLERAGVIGERMRRRLGGLAGASAHVGDVRGLGAMTAVEMIKGGDDLSPAPEVARSILQTMISSGVIAATAGLHGQVVRFLPPLVISDSELDEGLDVVAAAITS